MPRHGQDGDTFEDGARETAGLGRVGIRKVSRPVGHGHGQGHLEGVVLDPAAYGCSRLAAQLADEWVEYVAVTEVTAAMAGVYRRAVDRFCSAVDIALPDCRDGATVGLGNPVLARQVARWERELPASYEAGSMWPSLLANALRTLIIRRDDHPDRHVDPVVARLARGPRMVRYGETSELDEFSRQDKRALVRAAWDGVHALEKRLTAGWELAAQGQHPNQGSWLHLPDLLWGFAHGEIEPQDLRDQMPAIRYWPRELHSIAARPDGAVHPPSAKVQVARHLVSQLYPNTLDLHAFRVLLIDATGHTSEEVASFGEKDVEFLPGGVRLTMVKNRAGLVRHRAFRDAAAALAHEAQEPVDHVDGPRREVGAVVRCLLRATEQVRRKIPEIEDTLFVQAGVGRHYEMNFSRWLPRRKGQTFKEWMQAAGVTASGPSHIGRLRKSTKVEKAIVSGGHVSVAADDHLEQTFAGHYAHGTTLRIISGEVITAAQNHWFQMAVDGPTVIAADAEGTAQDASRLQELGLEAGQAEGIVQGELDMGVSHCRDPYGSPFSSAGELCSVAPLRCLECPNAWILPSQLPQLILFKEHLERVRGRLGPQEFTALWGQSYTNLLAALADRSPQEEAVAREHIAAGRASLHLPLSAHAEFDQ